MSKKVKNLIPLVIFFAAMATLTSCNRGMGCPNNFSIGDTAVEIAKQAVKPCADLLKQ